jgi:8-oxo-dGTP pyrophosphatase MutT (NUDIX family)
MDLKSRKGKMDNKINCSVTVMLVKDNSDLSGMQVGFIRRGPLDTFGGLLVAPGGKVEPTDGNIKDGVMYDCVEKCAVREVLEETGIELQDGDLFYFCSLTLANGRVVISMKTFIDGSQNSEKLIWLTRGEVEAHDDFAPGMKQEAIALFDSESA